MTFLGPIAYLTGEYPRATDTFIQREVAALRRLGVIVKTCSIRKTSPEHLVGQEQKTGAHETFYVLPVAKKPYHLVCSHLHFLSSGPRRYFSALKLAFKARPPGTKALFYQLIYFAEAGVLAHHMQKQGIRHLHNHIAMASATVAMLASRLSGIPFSFTLHGPDIFFVPHYWRLDLKISEAAFVLCISNFCRSQAMAFSSIGHWNKLYIVHCGVDPSRYQGAPSVRFGNKLLFVGRLAAVKGVPILIEALAQLVTQFPTLHLTLIGDGPERQALEDLAEKRGLTPNVTFVGYKSQDEVAQELMRSDLLVLPSFAEGIPVVLMEAMASGLPVVTTRIAGVPELVEDQKNGYLVAPGNVDELLEALHLVLSDPQKSESMGLVGKKKIRQDFDAAKEAKKLQNILSDFHNTAGC